VHRCPGRGRRCRSRVHRHREHQQKLRDGVEKLTEVLGRMKATLATYREDASEIEVENVATVS
jgi:hypothetical protein